MEYSGIVILVVIIVIAVKFMTGDYSDEEPWEKELRRIKQKHMEKKNNIKIMNEVVQVEIGTRDLLMRILMEMGCKYTVDENKRICFDFQGEHLWADADNDCKFINVYDAFWESRELDDVEGIALLKQAINTVNLSETVTIFYTINETDNILWVHCKKNFLFIPHIPELENYMKSMIAALFQAHYALGAELERLKKNGMPPQV